MPSENGLPPGWRKLRIRDVADTYSGGTPDRANETYFGGTIPWVKSGEVNRYKVNETEEFLTDEGLKSSSAKWVPKDSVLAAMYGATAGKFAWLSIEATINQAVLAIRAKEALAENKFLFHLLHWMGPQLLSNLQGSGQPNLNGELINSVEVLIPPLDEQRKLITVFDAIDDATEHTRTVIGQTRKVKTALLQDLLTNGLPGRHKSFKSVKHLGRLPKCWTVSRLGDLTPEAEGICYGVVQPGEEYRAGVPLVRVCDIENGELDPTKIKRIDPSIASGYKRSELRGGELLVTLVGTIGRCTIAPPFSAGFNIARAVAKVQLNSTINSRFVMHFLNTIANVALVGEAYQSARKTLNLAELSQFPIALPDRTEQDEIVQAADAVEFREKSENDRLTGLLHAKAALSQNLLTGRIRVPTKGGE